MKKSFLFLLTVTILPLLNSCSTFLFFERTVPPEITLEPHNYKIVFLNLFDYTSASFVKEKQEKVYHSAVSSLTGGLNQAFIRDSSMSFSVADTLRKGIVPGRLTVLLPDAIVRSICSQNQSNLLLTLDSLNLNITWDFDVYTNDDGSKTKTKTFYLNSGFYLSLFDSTGKLIDRSALTRSMVYREREALSILITFKPSLANAGKESALLAADAAEDYVSKFYPGTVREFRKLYAGKLFKESNALIMKRDYAGAAILLNKLAESQDANTSRKARFNLSVLNEAQAAKK